MSETHSKEKNHHGGTSAHCGRRHSGFLKYSSEMRSDESVTLQHLHTFSSCDFEAYRARGEEFRRRLSGTVLNALPISEVWLADCEYRGEWGGLFPVHLRFTHSNDRHVTLDILSPGSESPFWHGLIWINPDHTGLYVMNAEQFEPERIGRLFTRVEEMVTAGITAAEIVAVLGRKEGCV